MQGIEDSSTCLFRLIFKRKLQGIHEAIIVEQVLNTHSFCIFLVRYILLSWIYSPFFSSLDARIKKLCRRLHKYDFKSIFFCCLNSANRIFKLINLKAKLNMNLKNEFIIIDNVTQFVFYVSCLFIPNMFLKVSLYGWGNNTMNGIIWWVFFIWGNFLNK